MNGHNPEDHRLLEDILSACYSLHIVLKNYLSPTIDYSLLYAGLFEQTEHKATKLYRILVFRNLLVDGLNRSIYVLLIVFFADCQPSGSAR